MDHDRASAADFDVLLERIQGTPESREVVFLVGTPMSALKNGEGVPDAGQMAADIQEKYLLGRPLSSMDTEPQRYQQAFTDLLRLRGPDYARQVLRDTVLKAYDRQGYEKPECDNDKKFSDIEADELGWKVPVGTRALGRIVAEFPARFHDLVLTTNFDPLITIALRLAHCPTTQTLLQGDGNPAQTLVRGCHVVHLHGYWYGRDALHTAIQLGQDRPMLKAYLKDLMRSYTIVVVAYGGWDDLFTTAVREVSIEQNAEPDIVWTFHESHEECKEKENRIRSLMPEAYSQGRVQFYFGIDCHDLFPRLLDKLRTGNVAAGRPRTTWNSQGSVSEQKTDRMTGILQDVKWIWSGDEDAVQFGQPRLVEWFCTTRSIVIEEVATQADWKVEETSTPKHVCLFGGMTGGRHVATLFGQKAAESSASAREAISRVRVEIPWTEDSEDLLFSCRIQPMGERSLTGIAALLPPPERSAREPGPSTSLHLTPSQALKGVWLKISAAGGIFVVKLHADFSVTEHFVYDPRETWSGEWALGGNYLVLRFGGRRFAGWELETRPARAGLEANIDLQDWGIFAATERGHASLEKTPFLVVHVPPPNGGRASAVPDRVWRLE